MCHPLASALSLARGTVAAMGLCALLCAQTEAESALAEEVAGKGWIVFSALSDNGSWDLFAIRPDGSSRRQLTDTSEFEEAGARLSPDGQQMLYRQVARGTVLQHDRWGFLGRLVIAKPDGTEVEVIGEDGEFPWATWSPDGEQLACLTRQGIQIVDLASREVVREMPRNGIYQQLYWSPDGQWFSGTANVAGENWSVVRADASTGEVNLVHQNQCCTSDWFPDSDRVIFSKREKGQTANDGYGWTELWMADGDGENSVLLFGEQSHVYGGAVSPDGEYILFGRGPEDDGGGGEHQGGRMCIMRLSDAPTIAGDTPELRSKHPDAGDGPILLIGIGWEPFWTHRELW